MFRCVQPLTFVISFLACGATTWAQDTVTEPEKKTASRAGRDEQMARRLEGAEAHVYKTAGDVELSLYVFTPLDHEDGDRRPAIVFFFGGGWTGGSPGQFAMQCRYLASRGMVAITADYRVRSRHAATVRQCVADAKSAVRWVRAHASELGVDPDRIAAGGGSAGGHLGACVGVVRGLDEPGEDASISSVPSAMVLFNPVMALAPAKELSSQYQQSMEKRRQQFGGDGEAISPLHHVRSGLPPMIMFFGSADRLLESARLFDKVSRSKGNRCELKIWDGPGHGFFNFGRDGNVHFAETCRDMDRFLASLGYVEGEPTIEAFVESESPADGHKQAND